MPVETIAHVLAFAAGVAVVARTLLSAIKAFILPRGARDAIVGFVFRELRRVFNLLAPKHLPYERRDRIFAYYAPIALAVLAVTWLLLVMFGFAAMYWGLGSRTVGDAIRLSGSSLLTLGFSVPSGGLETILTFVEAISGLGLAALLVGYLPTMYSAFARRELDVNLLEVRADRPASAAAMLIRYHRLDRLGSLPDDWRRWEAWFAEVGESHTTLSALAFYRSAHPQHSWIVAAGAVLDAAALSRSLVDVPADVQADLALRAGYLCLRRIADFFGIRYDPAPAPSAPTSVTREKFDAVAAELEAAGLPLRADRDTAFLDFSGWRVNYDRPLLALSRLVLAPEAPWNGWPERDQFGRFGPTPGDAG
ncbi:MAG TPA: hypothetical protein VLS28_02635 [Candidatus Sulfomarinibacteraceae bacterium]|nr:hypothetical protein [Candidatus Sulfomarinibacteraceae bacterium]